MLLWSYYRRPYAIKNQRGGPDWPAPALCLFNALERSGVAGQQVQSGLAQLLPSEVSLLLLSNVISHKKTK